MLEQGLTLTIVGMLVVFSFLALLVAVMTILSAIIRRFFPEQEAVPAAGKKALYHTKLAIALAAAKAQQKNR